MNLKVKIKHLIIVIVITGLLPIGYLLAESKEIPVFYAVLELIKKVYVKDISDKKLVEAAISGMLTSLDPHSSFLDKKELEEMNESVKGEFGGIGVEILAEAQGLRVISPMDDTPAFKAGIQPKDLIFAINDDLVGNMPPAEAIKKMRGPKGSSLKIGIIREGMTEPLEINLTRDNIRINPAKFHLYNDIGYLRLATFSDQTTDAARKAIETMQKEAGNTKIKGYVLDLRNNPGGILKQSIQISDLFLDKGLIVSIKGREEKDTTAFTAKPGNLIGETTPLVILINGGSASASEIVAGALQDNKRALILGTRSFGKGSVQNLIDIPEYGAIRITTALYYTPSGKSIQAEGIVPDIIIEPARIELINNDDKKLQLSEAKLRNHLRNQEEETMSSITAKKPKDTVKNRSDLWKKLYEQDYQLARAIDVLKSMELLKKWR